MNKQPFLLSLLIVACVAFGCESEDPIESRRQELGYTPEKIAAELERRLEAHAKRGPQADGSDAKPDVDRRGNGPGGAPFSFDAIMDDIVVKIGALEQQEEFEDVASQVIDELNKSQLPEELKNRAVDVLEQ